MKNNVTCNNCNAENPYYNHVCSSCGGFLRTKVPNIDLWQTISSLLTSPIETAKAIIYAEKKNYIFPLLLSASLKFSLDSLMFFNATGFNKAAVNGTGIIVGNTTFFVIAVLFLSSIATLLNRLFGLRNRFRDIFASFVYSFIPAIILLIILTPMKIAVFGLNWFTFNPSPTLINNEMAILFFIIEIVFLVWSGFLFICFFYVQSRNIAYSVGFGGILFVLTISSSSLGFLFI